MVRIDECGIRKGEAGMQKAENETGLSLKLIFGRHVDFGFDCRVIFNPGYPHPGRRAD